MFSIEPFIKLQLIVLRPCVFWWQAGGALLNVKLIFWFLFHTGQGVLCTY